MPKKKRKTKKVDKTQKKASVARAQSAKRRKRKRTGKRTLHHILLLMFFIAAGVIMSFTVFFKIEAVSVSGCDKYSPEEIISFTQIEVGDNLFRVPAKKIAEQLVEQYPYIESANIHRSFPPSIEVRIVQSKPALAIAVPEGYALVTKEGKFLERGNVLIGEEVLLVKGLDVTGYTVGNYIGEWTYEQAPKGETSEEKTQRLARNSGRKEKSDKDYEAVKMISLLIESMKETQFENITNVDISDRNNMSVMYENRIKILLGSEGDLEGKLLMVKYGIEETLDPRAHGTINAAEYTSQSRINYLPDSGYTMFGVPIEEYRPGEQTDTAAQ